MIDKPTGQVNCKIIHDTNKNTTSGIKLGANLLCELYCLLFKLFIILFSCSH